MMTNANGSGWRMARAPGGRRVAMRWIRKPVLAPLVPESSCLSAAVAACVASSYGAVPAKELDDETTQVTVVARIGGAR